VAYDAHAAKASVKNAPSPNRHGIRCTEMTRLQLIAVIHRHGIRCILPRHTVQLARHTMQTTHGIRCTALTAYDALHSHESADFR
jgi:hypothetical protein